MEKKERDKSEAEINYEFSMYNKNEPSSCRRRRTVGLSANFRVHHVILDFGFCRAKLGGEGGQFQPSDSPSRPFYSWYEYEMIWHPQE